MNYLILSNQVYLFDFLLNSYVKVRLFSHLFHPKLVDNLTSDTVNCFFTHCFQNPGEYFRKWFDYLFCDTPRNFLIIRLRYSAGDAGKRVAVSSKINSLGY